MIPGRPAASSPASRIAGGEAEQGGEAVPAGLQQGRRLGRAQRLAVSRRVQRAPDNDLGFTLVDAHS